MRDLKRKSDFESHERSLTGPASAEPGYDDWVKTTIETAVAEADAHPEDWIPLEEIMKKFGLER